MKTDAAKGRIDWDDVKVFLAVARGQSIVAAAKELAVDHATVSRRLAAFERSMGALLVTRSRTGVRLTDEGAELHAIAERAQEPMLALMRRRETSGGTREGTVRLATSSIFSGWLLAKHVGRFMHGAPGVRLEINVGRRLIDLAKREADIALRLRPPGAIIAELSTVAVKLADVSFALYGLRESKPGKRRRYIRYSGLEPASRHMDTIADGTWAQLLVDDIPTALMLAREGCGAVVLPCFVADTDPSLVRTSDVLETHRLYLATLTELRRVPRVDAVIGWLKDVARRERRRLSGV